MSRFLKPSFSLSDSTQVNANFQKLRADLSTNLTSDTTLSAGINKEKLDFGIYTNDENATWSATGQVNPFSGKGKLQVGYSQPGFDVSGTLNTNGLVQASAGMDLGINDKLSMNGSVFGKGGWSAGAQYQHNAWTFKGNVSGNGSGEIGIGYNF